MTLGSSSNHDGDGNENGKKALAQLSKAKTLHVYHALSYDYN